MKRHSADYQTNHAWISIKNSKSEYNLLFEKGAKDHLNNHYHVRIFIKPKNDKLRY